MAELVPVLHRRALVVEIPVVVVVVVVVVVAASDTAIVVVGNYLHALLGVVAKDIPVMVVADVTETLPVVVVVAVDEDEGESFHLLDPSFDYYWSEEREKDAFVVVQNQVVPCKHSADTHTPVVPMRGVEEGIVAPVVVVEIDWTMMMMMVVVAVNSLRHARPRREVGVRQSRALCLRLLSSLEEQLPEIVFDVVVVVVVVDDNVARVVVAAAQQIHQDGSDPEPTWATVVEEEAR